MHGMSSNGHRKIGRPESRRLGQLSLRKTHNVAGSPSCLITYMGSEPKVLFVKFERDLGSVCGNITWSPDCHVDERYSR